MMQMIHQVGRRRQAGADEQREDQGDPCPGVLDGVPAGTEPELEAAVGQDVEGRGLPRQDGRVVQVVVRDHRRQAQIGRAHV